MLKFSRQVDYALLILTALAGRKRSFVSVRKLAIRHRLPYRFAAGVVGRLKKSGILESREGIHGGYRLARAPAAISLAEVLRSVEGPFTLVTCLKQTAGPACPLEPTCPSRSAMPALQHLFHDTLARQTVADLVMSTRSHG